MKNEKYINNNGCECNVLEDVGCMVSRYYQVWNPRIKRWVKIDSYTGLIVSVKKTNGEYKNIPKKPFGKVKKKKGFWDVF